MGQRLLRVTERRVLNVVSAIDGRAVEAGAEKRSKTKRKLLIKVGLSAVLIVLVYSVVDLKRVGSVLEKLNLWVALALIISYTVGQMFSAAKWRVFLQSVGIDRSYVETLRAYFFGMFVNLFGIGTVGGDVARGLAIRPGKGERVGALTTVFADRIHGLLTLASIAALAVTLSELDLFGPATVYLGVATILALCLGWLIGPRILVGLFPAHSSFGKASTIVARAFPREFRYLCPATIYSAIVHCIQIGMHLALAEEFGVPISYGYFFAVVPLVNIASTLPISFSGIGVREAMYLAFFVPIGVQPEVAVAFGAVWIVVATVVATIGGLAYSPTLERLLARDSETPPNGSDENAERELSSPARTPVVASPASEASDVHSDVHSVVQPLPQPVIRG